MQFEHATGPDMRIKTQQPGFYKLKSVRVECQPPLFPAQIAMAGLEEIEIPACQTSEDLVRKFNARSRDVHLSIVDNRLHADCPRRAHPTGVYGEKEIVAASGGTYELIDRIDKREGHKYESGELVDFLGRNAITGATLSNGKLVGPTVPAEHAGLGDIEYVRASPEIILSKSGRVLFPACASAAFSLIGKNTSILLRSPFFGLATPEQFRDMQRDEQHFDGYTMHGGEAFGRGLSQLAPIPMDSRSMILTKTATGMDVIFSKFDGTQVTALRVTSSGTRFMILDHAEQAMEIEPPILTSNARSDRDGTLACTVVRAGTGTVLNSPIADVASDGTFLIVAGVTTALPAPTAEDVLQIKRSGNEVQVTAGDATETVTVGTESTATDHVFDAAATVGRIYVGSLDGLAWVRNASPEALGTYSGDSFSVKGTIKAGVLRVNTMNFKRTDYVPSPDLRALLGVPVIRVPVTGDRQLPEQRIQSLIVEGLYAHDQPHSFYISTSRDIVCEYLDGVTKLRRKLPKNITWSLALAPDAESPRLLR